MKTLADLDDTHWAGTNELWLDPMGDKVTTCNATLHVEGSKVIYTWSHGGQTQHGTLSFTGETASFCDTFHSTDAMVCAALPGAKGLAQVQGKYGPDKDWGWRIGLVYRTPMEQLVLQMTNIAPWGEEARAVRMALKRSTGGA